jgi:hypothetical protein
MKAGQGPEPRWRLNGGTSGWDCTTRTGIGHTLWRIRVWGRFAGPIHDLATFQECAGRAYRVCSTPLRSLSEAFWASVGQKYVIPTISR